MIRLNRNPSSKVLCQFGLIWLLFFSLFSGLLWYRTGAWEYALILWGAALAVAAVGFIHLPFMRLIFLGLSYLTWPLGWVISHLLLGGVYYLVLTPIGLILKMTGRDPMNRQLERSASTYWVEHPRVEPPARYFKQF